MKEREVTLTMVKQKVFELPEDRLQEVYDFLDFILMKAEATQAKRVKKLEGIWEGIGFERISNLEQDIRDIRRGSEQALKCCHHYLEVTS